KYRNFDDLARDRAAALRGLASSDRRESGIVNRLDETIPECVEHGTQRVNALGPRYMFLRLRTNGAVIDQRPAADAGRAAIDHDSRIDESPARIDMADTHFRDLARAARDRIGVAISAGGRVEDRSDAVIHVLLSLKNRLVIGKSIACRLGD